MCFIYRYQADIHLGNFFYEYFSAEPFGRNIEKFIGVKNCVFECFQNFGVCHARIDCSRTDVAFFEVLHLIFHQCNKRCDNHANTFESHGRNLKSERFSASGRHQAKGIFTGDDALNDIFLKRTKRIVPPVCFEYLVNIRHYFQVQRNTNLAKYPENTENESTSSDFLSLLSD